MAQFYQEHLKQLEKNPLYQLSVRVENCIVDYIDEDAYMFLFSGVMTPSAFSVYLVFEAVAQDIRNNQRKDASPLYKYVKEISAKDFLGNSPDPAAINKPFQRDLALRKKFLTADAKRSRVPRIEELEWLHSMKNQKDYRHGYTLTSLQFEQLHDRDDFFIKKTHELRRFITPKHAPAADVKRYYSSLVNHAQKCQKEIDPRKRVVYAINLNDFESRNLSFFLAKVAAQCCQKNITHIDDTTENLLLALTGAISLGDDGCLVTHRPVPLMDRYIPAALNCDLSEINRYVQLILLGLYMRIEVIPDMMKECPYTYEDFDAFIQSSLPLPKYNVFDLYSEPNWDEKGQTISILRTLIKKLTVDPLS